MAVAGKIAIPGRENVKEAARGVRVQKRGNFAKRTERRREREWETLTGCLGCKWESVSFRKEIRKNSPRGGGSQFLLRFLESDLVRKE